MKTLRMTLMISFTFAAMMTLAKTTTTAAEPTAQTFKLRYLKEVTKGPAFHTITVKAKSFEDAIVVSGKQCISDMLDRHVNRDDIVDLCNNPRL